MANKDKKEKKTKKTTGPPLCFWAIIAGLAALVLVGIFWNKNQTSKNHIKVSVTHPTSYKEKKKSAPSSPSPQIIPPPPGAETKTGKRKLSYANQLKATLLRGMPEGTKIRISYQSSFFLWATGNRLHSKRDFKKGPKKELQEGLPQGYYPSRDFFCRWPQVRL